MDPMQRLLMVGAVTAAGAATGVVVRPDRPAVGAASGNIAALTIGGSVDVATHWDEERWTPGAVVAMYSPIAVLSTLGAVFGASLWERHPVVGSVLGSAAGYAVGEVVGFSLLFMGLGGPVR